MRKIIVLTIVFLVLSLSAYSATPKLESITLQSAMDIYTVCKTYFGVWTPNAQEHVQGYNNWKTQFNAGDTVLIPQLLEKNADGTYKLDVNGNKILTRTDILSQTEIVGATQQYCVDIAQKLSISLDVFRALNPSLPCK